MVDRLAADQVEFVGEGEARHLVAGCDIHDADRRGRVRLLRYERA
jgi:hypothetical protein